MITVLCPICKAQIHLYTTDEAATYLDLSESSIKYHVHTAGNLHPQKVSHSLVFTQEQLDEFQTTRRPAGRPRTQKEDPPCK